MKRALIDLSSVIWTCLLAGKDTEFGVEVQSEAGKAVFVNSASFGYENCLNHLHTVMDELKITPRQMIFVVEGPGSKEGRQFLHPLYKAGRDKVPLQYEQFNLIKAQLLAQFLGLGAQSVTQEGGVESDDVIGYLALNLQGERWIVSADKDLASVLGPNVHHYRMGVIDKNPFGDFDPAMIPTCIALCGDPSDKIPGAKGFGEKSFMKLLAAFGDDGLELMTDLIRTRKLEKLQEDVPELPILQKIIDDRDNVYMSYELGRLRIEKVNTLKRPLQWTVGMVKPKDQCEEQTLRKFAGSVTLVTKENYQEALDFFTKHSPYTPEFTLDIETSTPPESDEWIERLGKSEDRTPVDVFGSTLTGMSITFGRNMQYTYYIAIDHVEEPNAHNVAVDDVVAMLDLIPPSKHIVVHNAAFELPVCFMSFGDRWIEDQRYHGFLRNVIDTRIMSSYVDENRSAGLKSLSENLLGYKQSTYQDVTTIPMNEEEWKDRGCPGKVLQRIEQEPVEYDDGAVEPGYTLLNVQHKMNELTAKHVRDYGADDSICTSALSNYFRIIMEIERTWDVFMEVEQFPAYVTAKAFVDGTEFSLETMAEMEKDDDIAFDKANAVLRDYLIKIGFEGTRFEPLTELNAAGIKRAHLEIVGSALETMVRTPSKLAKLIREREVELGEEESSRSLILADLIDADDLKSINEMMQARFSGEPQLDLASSKQMAVLLYDHMKLPINIINDCTEKEKADKEDLAEAVSKFKRKRGGKPITMTDKEMALVRTKAKVDDTAIDTALAFDLEFIDQECQEVLKAIGIIKKVMTRRSLFYKNYWNVKHWKDGKIHAQINQCAAVTRRYSSSNPNVQQLPKKGEAVRFRGCFLPHKRDAVIGSIDFVAQELRLGAERSQDKNMLACYVGDKLKDIHSITAAGAMKLKWGAQAVRDYFDTFGADVNRGPDADYDLFLILRKIGKADPAGKRADDLRKDSKNVNFAAQFGGQAAKLADTLIMKLEDAQLFLDARSAMFPDVDKAAKRSEEFCKKTGYSLTLMGARRHLREAITSEDRWAASRAARQAWNFEIQGSAAEMSKLAMSRLWLSGALHRYDVIFIAPIHDEFVVSVHKDHCVDFMREMHAAMTAPYADMKVPILGSSSIGPNFAEQTECGDYFDEACMAKMRQTLNDIFHKEEATA